MNTPNLPKDIETMCAMIGIDPARLLTRADIDKLYPGMPLVQNDIWENVQRIQAQTTETLNQ